MRVAAALNTPKRSPRRGVTAAADLNIYSNIRTKVTRGSSSPHAAAAREVESVSRSCESASTASYQAPYGGAVLALNVHARCFFLSHDIHAERSL